MMKKGTGQGIQLKNELIKKLDEIITLEKPAYKSRHHLIEVLAEKELKKLKKHDDTIKAAALACSIIAEEK